jgi:hypothetical protein
MKEITDALNHLRLYRFMLRRSAKPTPPASPASRTTEGASTVPIRSLQVSESGVLN